MPTYEQRMAKLNKQLQEERADKENKMKWICEIRRGHTGYILSTHKFPTFKKAEDFYKKRKSSLRFAGIGGKYQQYVTYPREIKVGID